MKGERVSRTRSAISLALWALAVALWVPAQGLAQEAAADAPQEESAEAALAEEEEAPPPVPPLVADAQRLVAHLDAVEAKVRALQAQAQAAEGEDRLVLKKQIMEAKLEYLDVMGRVVDNLVAQEKESLEAPQLRVRVEKDLTELTPAIVEHIDESEETLSSLRKEREGLPPEALLAADQHIAKEAEWIISLYQAYVGQVFRMESVGLDGSKVRADVSERLGMRAEIMQGRLKLIVEQLAQLRQRLQGREGDAALQAELAALEQRKKVTTGSLGSMVKMMGSLGIEVAAYQQLLITATGEVTADIFRAKVAMGLLDQWVKEAKDWALENGPAFVFKLIMFFLLVFLFKLLSVVTRRIMQRAFGSGRVQTSRLLQDMTVTIVSNSVLLLGILVGLSQLGVELGPLLAGLGIAGFIVGFALQDSLANFAAGMMILGYRPYDVGDMIEAAGVFGKVNQMSLVSTTILTIDNQTLIVPNGKIWGDVIKNVTHQSVRRVDMTFRVSYSEDVEHVERVLQGVIAEDSRVLADPEPMVKLHKLNESSVDFVVRPWVETDDYWDVYWDMTRAVKQSFDAEGIRIPFPQRQLHIDSGASRGGSGATDGAS
jgi:small conductance mechanosensitive channel